MTLHQMKEIAEAHGFKANIMQKHVEVEIPATTKNGAHYIVIQNAYNVRMLRHALGY